MFDAALKGAVNSVRIGARKKIMNDIMYYLRKLLKLARKAQTIGEGVEDLENQKIIEELEFIKSGIKEIEEELNR